MRSEIKPLTGVRGVAAFTVMIYHFGEPFNTFGIKTGFHVPQGYMAVDLFYILSGFVLSYTYTSIFHADFSFSRYRDFMVKRMARIYPAYIAVVFFFLLKMIVNFAGDDPLTKIPPLDALGNIFMMTGWGLNIKSFIPDSWSVSAEVICYIIFPILLYCAILQGRLVALATAVAAIGGILFVAFSGLGVKGPLDVVFQTSFFPLLRCVAGFTLGILTFRASREVSIYRFLSREVLFWIAMILVAGCIASSANDLVLFACFPLVVAVLSRGGSGASAVFANPLVHHLGEISYSLYLIHPMFVSVAVRMSLISDHRFGFHLPYWQAAIIGMAITWVISFFSFTLIEIPGKRAVLALVGRFRQASVV